MISTQNRVATQSRTINISVRPRRSSLNDLVIKFSFECMLFYRFASSLFNSQRKSLINDFKK